MQAIFKYFFTIFIVAMFPIYSIAQSCNDYIYGPDAVLDNENPAGGYKTVTVETDTPGCPNFFQYHIQIEDNDQDWLSVAEYYDDDDYGYVNIKFKFEPFSSLYDRKTTVYFVKTSTGVVSGEIEVEHKIGRLQNWFPDEDGDGVGHTYTNPTQAVVGPTGWVNNGNWSDGSLDVDEGDQCPFTPAGIDGIDGCPRGISPDIGNDNWVSSKSYDINGNLKANGISFYNALGKLRQKAAWNYKTDDIWGSELVYDYQGRPALQSLSFPSKSRYFDPYAVQSNIYTQDFDTGDLDDPKELTDNAREGTLAWYYSDNNDRNPYQDITTRPYSRTIYSKLNPGTALKTIGGNKINDEWKNSYVFSMPAGRELTQPGAFGSTAYSPEHYKITKTVSRDIHGIENVVFTDTDGKILASARSGNEEGSTIINTSVIQMGEQQFVDIHIPVGLQGITVENVIFGVLTNNHWFEVYDLITEQKVTTAFESLPSGFYRISYIAAGQPSISITYNENYYDYSLNEYDKAGRLVSSKQPLQHLESTFEYNALGQLTQTHSPDEGDAWFLYRKDGQIRFSINSKQWKNKEFSYTNYDSKGRPIESGVFSDTSLSYLTVYSTSVNETTDPFTAALKSLVDTPDGDGLADANCSEVNVTRYDTSSGTNLLDDDYEFPTFLAGNVAKTENENTTTWYSYDIYGRVKWVVQRIEGLSGYKTIDYEYDPVTSQVTKVWYQKGDNSDEFIHRYTYDPIDYSLTKVETSTDNVNYTEHATYEYNETGSLKRLNLAQGLQGMDYVYNLNGALKSINHPSLVAANDPGGDSNDLFGMNLHYYEGDYSRNTTKPIPTIAEGIDQFNGNIKAITWNTDRDPAIVETESNYYYDYNKNNWLKGASFNDPITEGGSNVSPTETRNQLVTSTEEVKASQKITLASGFRITATSSLRFKAKIGQGGNVSDDGEYNVYDISYDANGNILTLNRNKHEENGSNEMDKLSYAYKTDKPNQLLRVDDAVTATTNADDIKDQYETNYIYNEIGQLVYDFENVSESQWQAFVSSNGSYIPSDAIKYSYNASGLVNEVRVNDRYVKFYYNDRGQRIRKETQNDSYSSIYTTFYVRDAAGTPLAVYDKVQSRGGETLSLTEHTIQGGGRLGVRKSDGTNLYQLTDHLGNVRAVVGRANDGQPMAITSATDYYPFGMPMPDKNQVGDYRYAFQGQEKDPETGKEAFEQRLWDSRIGRWLIPDPAGKGDSPYTGMYNNPERYIDVKGRDTLNIYRSRLLSTGENGLVDQYKLNFEIIKNGESFKQELVLYMYAHHDFERGPHTGDNALDKKGVYPIRFQQMGSHMNEKNYENTIQLQGPVFAHPGHPLYNIGCKTICETPDYEFGNILDKKSQSFRDTVDSLKLIRDLYNTTDQKGFFFITNRRFPVEPLTPLTPHGITPSKYQVITGDPIPIGITN